MKIMVISLTQSAQRRANIVAQFRKLRLPFEFFDAISGRDALKHVHHYDDREFVLNCGRSAAANEIGCYASHLALWRQCTAEQEAFLILEDDAYLSTAFPDGLELVANRINRKGFIRVSTPETNSYLESDFLADFEVRRCRRVPLLAIGYAISPAIAAKLASRGTIVREPVDKYLQRYWLHKQSVFALQPAVVAPGENAACSDIGTRSKPAASLGLWAQRALRKTENSIRRDLYSLGVLLRNFLPLYKTKIYFASAAKVKSP